MDHSLFWLLHQLIFDHTYQQSLLKKHKSQLTLVDFLSFGLIEYLMIDYIYLDFILIIILNLLYVLFQEACCFDQ